MGKAEMCIKMLQILNTGRLYKISELAELLETKNRNIIEYKKELDELSLDGGFYIETVPGRYGGYRLNGNITIPALRLLVEEKKAMLEAYNYILAKKDFIKKKEFISAFSKVLSNVQIDEKVSKLTSVDAYQLTMEDQDIQERYRFIEHAIKVKKSIEVEYASLKSGLKTHILDPYQLFLYNNAWFFFAWNHEAMDVHYFKLNRVKSYKLLDKKFSVYKFFKPEEFFNGNGFKYSGEYHHLVLIATGARAMMIKERKYGKNQVVEELEDGSIKVEMDMQNEDMILSFVLQGKSEIKVLEPQWLIEKIKSEIEKIVTFYKK